MSGHPEPIDLLSAYVDGELDAATRDAITRHLAQCARCRADVEEQRQIKRFLTPGAPLAPPVPAGLAQRVRGRTFAPAAPAPARRAWWRALWPSSGPGWAVAAALAVVLLLAGVGLGTWGSRLFAPSPAAEAAAMSIEDHAMTEQLGAASGTPAPLAQVRDQLSSALGMPITVPAQMPTGYQFYSGQAVSLDTTQGAHLTWMQGHAMISLYQAHDPGGAAPAGWQAMDMHGSTYWMGQAGPYEAVFWRHNGMMYVVCGALPEETLLGVAQSMGTT